MYKKNDDIKNAIRLCNCSENCAKCAKKYVSPIYGDIVTPCNIIRKFYGVSIWDYK